jgi:hypothetical protein
MSMRMRRRARSAGAQNTQKRNHKCDGCPLAAAVPADTD